MSPTIARTRVLRGTYRDSVMLLSAAATMDGAAAVTWASAVMGIPDNLEDLIAQGVPRDELDAGPNDLILAVLAESDSAAEAALDAGENALSQEQTSGAEPSSAHRPRSLTAAAETHPGANLAVISVPGAYAALEAHKALTAGLHVLLFSDNVPVAEEVELKNRAAGLGLLVMGPGAGTSVLAGTGLGFANAVQTGRVGIVAASGTGAQEVMTLASEWGAGISRVIGVGGRDLGSSLGGRMTRQALRSLNADPGTEIVVLVSKPPDPSVAREMAGCTGKPLIAALVGMPDWPDAPPGFEVAASLEQAAAQAVTRAGVAPPGYTGGLAERARNAIAGLGSDRTAVRGYFSGGTLCSESQLILSRLAGAVHSNIPLTPERALPAPPGRHVCLDLGEEEYTRGRPHPMIDPQARVDVLTEDATGDDVAVVLLDVVLGYGSHSDPAGALAPVCSRLAAGDGPRVVAYVLGTNDDPQCAQAQRDTLEQAGCLLAPTAARAAHLAAAIATRRPELAELIP
jgi:FdrA protein